MSIPAAIFTPIQDKGKFTTAGNKKYSLFIAPKSESLLRDYCFTEINDGTTFCIECNCQVNHRGAAERINVRPGEVFIRSAKNRAFKEPVISSLKWTTDFTQDAEQRLGTMDHWLYFFRIVKNMMDEDATADIDKSRYQKEHHFQTPSISYKV